MISFEKTIILSDKEIPADNSPIQWNDELVSFAYPFIVDGKICSGYDKPPKLVFTLQNIKTKGQLATAIVNHYRFLFNHMDKFKLSAFHTLGELELSGLEKDEQYGVWNLVISS